MYMCNFIKIVYKYILFKIMGEIDLICKIINIFVICICIDDKLYWFDVVVFIFEYFDLVIKVFNSMKIVG